MREQHTQKIQERARNASDKAAALRKQIAAKRLESILRYCGARNDEIREGAGFRRTLA